MVGSICMKVLSSRTPNTSSDCPTIRRKSSTGTSQGSSPRWVDLLRWLALRSITLILISGHNSLNGTEIVWVISDQRIVPSVVMSEIEAQVMDSVLLWAQSGGTYDCGQPLLRWPLNFTDRRSSIHNRGTVRHIASAGHKPRRVNWYSVFILRVDTAVKARGKAYIPSDDNQHQNQNGFWVLDVPFGRSLSS